MITTFHGEHAFLSNFHPSQIVIFGSTFATVEHAFQSWKMESPSDAYLVNQQKSPGLAKKCAKGLTRRNDWDLIKKSVMYTCCTLKFVHEPFRSLLLETDDQYLVEGNTWGDTYWGQCNGIGQNNLGLILMAIRQDLHCAN